jgi:hypothetical protein
MSDKATQDRGIPPMSKTAMRQVYRPLSDTEKADIEAVKDSAQAFYDRVDAIGQSREMSLAKTRIEEACMWAVKHISAEKET